MSGINGAKYKLMPESPHVNLKEIEEAAKKIVEDFGGKNKEYSIEDIAFGLKAVIVFFFYSDDKNIDIMEEKLSKINNVASAQLIDMRKIA
jgi:translation elongation factor aEF-1 beta